MFVGRDAADNPRPEYLLTQGSRIAREDPARGSGTTKVGDVVVPGDVLGRSGAANGVDHLHFAMTASNYDDDDETRSVNPVPLVRAHVGGPSACAASASPNSHQKPTPARLGSRDAPGPSPVPTSPSVRPSRAQPVARPRHRPARASWVSASGRSRFPSTHPCGHSSRCPPSLPWSGVRPTQAGRLDRRATVETHPESWRPAISARQEPGGNPPPRVDSHRGDLRGVRTLGLVGSSTQSRRRSTTSGRITFPYSVCL